MPRVYLKSLTQYKSNTTKHGLIINITSQLSGGLDFQTLAMWWLNGAKICVDAQFAGRITQYVFPQVHPLGLKDIQTHISLLCLQPLLSGSRNRGCPWPQSSVLLLSSVLSTAQRFANSPIRCQNAATRHQLSMSLPRVSTELVGCFRATAAPASFTLLCYIVKQMIKS